MQRARDSVLLKIATGGENLRGEAFVAFLFPLHLAQIGRLSVPEQGFEYFLFGAAPDLGLEVATAGRTMFAIRSSAGGFGARVDCCHQGESPATGRHRLGWGEVTGRESAAINDPEAVPAELPRLDRPFGGWHGGNEAISGAGDLIVTALAQVAAGYVDPRLGPEFFVDHLKTAEFYPLGMSKQPGGVVVFTPLNRRNSESDIKCMTVSADAAAWWWCHGIQGKGAGCYNCDQLAVSLKGNLASDELGVLVPFPGFSQPCGEVKPR